MPIALVLLFPVLAAPVMFLLRNRRLNAALAALYAVLAAAAAVSSWFFDFGFTEYFRTDDLNRLFFSVVSVLNLAAVVYSIDYLRHLDLSDRDDALYWIFYTGFIACMSGVLFATHLGLVWVFIEATTLATAFLIHLNRTKASLEATWKYLFICSVGISLAFVGIIFLSLALRTEDGLFFASMYHGARVVDLQWLRIAFVFILVGFGTKMGLAPVHAWLPDAHAESTSPVSALLSGSLLNAAFLGILRVYRALDAAGEGGFARGLLTVMGLLSLLVAATYILRVLNYKRLLAYSSIENMGILALAVGAGGAAAQYACMLHLVGHSLAKSLLFFAAGSILARYQTKRIDKVRGLFQRDPLTAWLWLAGMAAIVGIPPSPLFISEFLLVREYLARGDLLLALAFLVLLTVILYGFASVTLRMLGGSSEIGLQGPASIKPGRLAHAPQLVLAGLLVVIGVGLPDFLARLIRAAAEAIA